MKSVLILCTGNSCRSQMAEGLFRQLAGSTYEVHSAGTHPSTVNPLAIKAVSEVGIDISHQYSKSVSEFLDRPFDLVISVCDNAKESCPYFPGAAKRLHWPFEDPAESVGPEAERLKVFERVRDEIQARIVRFLKEGL
jgi:arsenate reductase (thioredoxin)